jgi:hypothetical protein
MLKMVGNSGQRSLGKQYAGRCFEVELREDGSIVLTPMRVIPESDAWLYTAEMQERLRAADDWMDRNPPAETDLDALEKKLENSKEH